MSALPGGHTAMTAPAYISPPLQRRLVGRRFPAEQQRGRDQMAGLFDFVKTIGKKIFGEGDADAAAKIKAEIEKDNPGVKDLGVKFDNGKVELSGSGPAEALQKAILIAGNAMGVGEVKLAGAAASAVDDGTQYYVIKSGDTLSAIAKQFYGDANQYPKIFEANREVIKDANLIFPGQKIRIPKA
jgi:nucleoid-associated protein YgaU